jgi:hypothetical protein
MATRLKRITATGLVLAGPCWLKSVALKGGSANSTVLVQDSLAGGGTDVLELAAVIASAAGWTSGDEEGAWFSLGVYATLAGTGASASFEIEA